MDGEAMIFFLTFYTQDSVMHLLWPSPYPYPVTKNCVIIPVKIMDDNNPSSANSDQVYEIWEAKKNT